MDKEKEKQVVLGEMIDRIVLSQYAAENKLDQEPDNYLLMKRVRENILVQAAIRKLLKDNPVTDEDLKKRFQQEVEKTHKTEYKVRHILVKSEDEAQGLVAQIKKGGNFAALAKPQVARRANWQKRRRPRLDQPGYGGAGILRGRAGAKKGQSSRHQSKTDYGFTSSRWTTPARSRFRTSRNYQRQARLAPTCTARFRMNASRRLAKDLKTKAKVTMN